MAACEVGYLVEGEVEGLGSGRSSGIRCGDRSELWGAWAGRSCVARKTYRLNCASPFRNGTRSSLALPRSAGVLPHLYGV